MNKITKILGFYFVIVLIFLSGCAGLANIAGSGKLTSAETPSIELSIVRLADVEQAANQSDFYMNSAAIGKDSAWPVMMLQVDEKYANYISKKLRAKGPYSKEAGKRFIMPLAFYLNKFAEIKPLVQPKSQKGDYKNFFDAFVALAGDDGKSIRDKNIDLTKQIEIIAEKAGRIEELEAINKQEKTTDTEKTKNKEEIAGLNKEKDALETEFDKSFAELIAKVDAIGDKKDLVSAPDKLALANKLCIVALSITSLQEQAVAAAGIALVQFGRAVYPPSNILTESQNLIKRWKKEGILDAPEKAKELFANIITVPGRLKKVSTLLGKAHTFNSHVVSSLAKLTGQPVVQPISFDPMKY